MKILSADQIRAADRYTILHEPISSTDLMERAGRACYQWIAGHYDRDMSIKVVCGTGNNGGDGLVIARLLALDGYRVEVIILNHSTRTSPDFEVNCDRLMRQGGVPVSKVSDRSEMMVVQPNDLVIDAIFGSGLTKPLSGFVAEIVRDIRQSGCQVVSVDLPSGLFADQCAGLTDQVVCATVTLSLQFVKLSMLFPEHEDFVGRIEVMSIGLHPGFIEQVEVAHYLTDRALVAPWLRPVKKYAHKGHYGHALLVAGSYGKMGAAVLSARSCLRGGVGLLTVRAPACGCQVLQSTVPEAMVSADVHEYCITGLPDLSAYSAIGVGPGLGQAAETESALLELFKFAACPIVLDADALNILSKNSKLLDVLPSNTVLTPHRGEFVRLVGPCRDQLECIQKQGAFARKYNVVMVLKGAHTSIALPDGRIFFNTTGNPAMATAGAGDVLTGLILGLLAQGYSPWKSAVLGVYLHGLAGDIALQAQARESLIAGDIIERIGAAFSHCKS